LALAPTAIRAAESVSQSSNTTAAVVEDAKGAQFVNTNFSAGNFRNNSRTGTWLGLATEEVQEALASQLQLGPGVGLVVTYVVPDSPAAKAGLQRNDVITEFDGQALILPAQLRKLVQVRKDGEKVRVTFFRAGKKDSASVTLSKTDLQTGLLDGQRWDGKQQGPEAATDQYTQLLSKEYGDALRDKLKDLQHSLGELQIDQGQVSKEILHSIEEARKASADAARSATNALRQSESDTKILEYLSRGTLGVSKDVSITINSADGSRRSIVRTDNGGTYVIVANPRKHLTVHDPSRKLLFNGEIETQEEQAAVPREIWDKVKPMLKKLGDSETGNPLANGTP